MQFVKPELLKFHPTGALTAESRTANGRRGIPGLEAAQGALAPCSKLSSLRDGLVLGSWVCRVWGLGLRGHDRIACCLRISSIVPFHMCVCVCVCLFVCVCVCLSVSDRDTQKLNYLVNEKL